MLKNNIFNTSLNTNMIGGSEDNSVSIFFIIIGIIIIIGEIIGYLYINKKYATITSLIAAKAAADAAAAAAKAANPSTKKKSKKSKRAASAKKGLKASGQSAKKGLKTAGGVGKAIIQSPGTAISGIIKGFGGTSTLYIAMGLGAVVVFLYIYLKY